MSTLPPTDAKGWLQRIERHARALFRPPKSPAALFKWQLDLAEIQRGVQAEIARTKREPKSAGRARDLADLRWARRSSRLLGDTLAWVVFGMRDRDIVPLGSNDPVAIPPDNDGWLGVLCIAQAMGEKGLGFPVFHDVTDCLRIGDLTFVHMPEGESRKREFHTVEVKTHASGTTADDGSREIQVTVNSVGLSPRLDAIQKQFPQGPAFPSTGRPLAGSDLTKAKHRRQIDRMHDAAIAREASTNTIADLTNHKLLTLEVNDAKSSKHTEILQRVARRARREGWAIEACDEAFAYAAFYSKEGLSSDQLSKMDFNDATIDALQGLVVGENTDTPKEWNSIYLYSRPDMREYRRASKTSPFFLWDLPRTTIYDMLHGRMSVVVVVNPGRIASALVRAGLEVSPKFSGKSVSDFSIRSVVADADGNEMYAELPSMINLVYEAVDNFAGVDAVVQRATGILSAMAVATPDLIDTARTPDGSPVGGIAFAVR